MKSRPVTCIIHSHSFSYYYYFKCVVGLDFVLNFLFHNTWIISTEKIRAPHTEEDLASKCAV